MENTVRKLLAGLAVGMGILYAVPAFADLDKDMADAKKTADKNAKDPNSNKDLKDAKKEAKKADAKKDDKKKDQK
jgi:hypothetical protein